MSRKISMLVFVILLLVSCSGIGYLKNYTQPTHSIPELLFEYTLDPNQGSEIDLPILIAPPVINMVYGIDLESGIAQKEAWDYVNVTNASVALQNVEEVDNVNLELSKSISVNVKRVLHQYGFKNLLSVQNSLKKLSYIECSFANIVVVPKINIKTSIRRSPLYYDEWIGRQNLWGGDSPSVYRDSLIVDITSEIYFEIYEPFTETLISGKDINAPQPVESKNNRCILDINRIGKYTSDQSNDIYRECVYTDIGLVYYNFFSKNFQSLLTQAVKHLKPEMISTYENLAKIKQERYIPEKDTVHYTYNYTPKKNYKKLENVFAVMLKSANIGNGGEVINDFENELSSQVIQLFKSRGVEVLGNVEKIEDLVYMDKKKSYFAISFDKQLHVNGYQNLKNKIVGKLDITKYDLSINGKFGISILETMTKQKLLQKEIGLNSSSVEVTRVLFDDKFNKLGKMILMYNNEKNKVSYLLDDSFGEVMDGLWQILSPESIKEIKSNVNEIRAKTGFPIIN